MSSVFPINAPTIPLGTGKVNALALDAQVAALVEQINALIQCLGVIRQSRGRLANGVVSPRQLSDACNNDLANLLLVIAKLRRQYATSYDPREAITVAPTITDSADTIPFFIGQAPPVPDFVAPMTLSGISGRKYAMLMRLRSVARGSAVVAVGASSPGFNAENRLYLGAAAAPVGSARERVGVQHPDGYAYINALDQAAQAGASDGGYAAWLDSQPIPSTINVTFNYTRGGISTGCVSTVEGLATGGTVPDILTATLRLAGGIYYGSIVIASVPDHGNNGNEILIGIVRSDPGWRISFQNPLFGASWATSYSSTLRGSYPNASEIIPGFDTCPLIPVQSSAIVVYQ